MRVYLEESKIYCKNVEGKVYEVKYYEGWDGYESIHLNLVNIHDEEDTETVPCYFMSESVKECLEANEYTIIDKPVNV